MTVTQPFLFDTHCHLDYIAAGQHGHAPNTPLDAIIAKAKEQGVGLFLNPGVDPTAWQTIIDITNEFNCVYGALAIHPCEVEDALKAMPHWLKTLESLLAKHPKLVAIGETGLDYYHKPAEACELQRVCFQQALALAEKLKKPIIIHDREAHSDVAHFVDQYPTVKGVMHCFSGDEQFALDMVERGYMISFAGNVTFKKATALREAAKVVPLSHLLLETDSPFLSPMPERGQPNQPYRTRFVADCIAEVKGISLNTLAEATTNNACRLFQLEPITVHSC
jgi:TatD DNase family protein